MPFHFYVDFYTTNKHVLILHKKRLLNSYVLYIKEFHLGFDRSVEFFDLKFQYLY